MSRQITCHDCAADGRDPIHTIQSDHGYATCPTCGSYRVGIRWNTPKEES